MLLTVDIGNTNIKLAVFDNNERITFDMLDSTLIDFRSFILSFLYKANIRETQIDDSILSSVVPSLTEPVVQALKEITNKEPFIIDNKNHYGIEISEKITDEVGSDLLVAGAYSYQMYNKELILVSLGTATVFAHISIDGKFSSCIIAPGFESYVKSLYEKAEKLPEFTPEKNNTFLSTSTVSAMNVGAYDGFIGMVKYLLIGMKTELGSTPMIVGCGGVGKNVAPYITDLDTYNADLVTEGLNFIYNRYIKWNK